MSDNEIQPAAEKPSGGRRKRPNLGLPVARENRWTGPTTSFLIHALLVALAMWPASNVLFDLDEEGAGGAGPAGGGGGGMGGTGGVTNNPERLQFVVVAPEPVIVPPVEEKKPEVVPPPVPTPEVVPVADTVAKATVADIASNTTGMGGGSGNDGTTGTGPGSGGGVGSGDGPGRGSGTGPGTGGGSGTVYPATPTTLVMPPVPAPARVKPYEMVAQFIVDSLGRATLLAWTKSRDDAYNRRVEASLRGFKFRPAVNLDGVPVVDTVEVRAWVR